MEETQQELRAEQELAEEFDSLRVVTRSAGSAPSSPLNRSDELSAQARVIVGRHAYVTDSLQIVEQAR